MAAATGSATADGSQHAGRYRSQAARAAADARPTRDAACCRLAGCRTASDGDGGGCRAASGGRGASRGCPERHRCCVTARRDATGGHRAGGVLARRAATSSLRAPPLLAPRAACSAFLHPLAFFPAAAAESKRHTDLSLLVSLLRSKRYGKHNTSTLLF